MIILTVTGKRFGQNFIRHKARNTDTMEIITEGKCGDYVTTREIYVDMMNEYGEENVKLLTN